MPVDLVLSSGFLAFARHVGFLDAVEARGIEVGGICGTSSGAMIGALWAAGQPLDLIAEVVGGQQPLSMCGLHLAPWKGLFSLDRVVARMAEYLPPTFADLPYPFAAGVYGPDGRPALLTHGSLPEAVAASCAIPYLFVPRTLHGTAWRDGGVKDRTGIGAWRALRPEPPLLVHLVERSKGGEDAGLEGHQVVRSPRSGASLWNLGDFQAQRGESREIALQALG